MGTIFESALLFSLAILIVLVALLIYYFKGRITDLEQKNIKNLEIIDNIWSSHLELKKQVIYLLEQPQPLVYSQTGGGHINNNQENKIKIEFASNSDDDNDTYVEEEDLEDEEDVSDNEEPNDYNTTAEDCVDIGFEQMPLTESSIKIVNLNTTPSLDMESIQDLEESEDTDDDNASVSDIEIEEITEENKITVQKVETQEQSPINAPPIIDDAASYKKMSLTALRGYIVSRGIHTDVSKLHKMKKNELIDMILHKDADAE